MVACPGVGAFLAKCDLKNAYKSVNVRPADWHLLGFRFHLPDSGSEMFYFTQVTLPFGLRNSCAEFEWVAGSV